MTRQDSIGALIHRIARSSIKALQAELEPLGLTAAQFFILQCLSRETGQTQKALAEHLEITSPSLTAMLKPLEEKGLIRRETDSRDARAKLIYLTDEGKKFSVTESSRPSAGWRSGCCPAFPNGRDKCSPENWSGWPKT